METLEKHGVNIDVNADISKLSSEEAFYLLNYHFNIEATPVIQKNIDKIATILLSGIDNNTHLKNISKPLLWRLGYIK